MPRKKTTSTARAPSPGAQVIENVSTRSVFGDNRGATEHALMSAHAKHLRRAGHIDEEMEVKLSKPWHESGKLHIKYTPEYLAQHPNYTGKNHDKIPKYETALKHQKARDEAQDKLLADWAAGKIDEHGNSTEEKEDQEEGEEHTGDTTSTASTPSPPSSRPYPKKRIIAISTASSPSLPHLPRPVSPPRCPLLPPSTARVHSEILQHPLRPPPHSVTTRTWVTTHFLRCAASGS
ncbi:hypothetical protein N0V83_001327 [Neocucurbitaria cava]|uniref:Uncharacterized protein n=1 Tax=Neocucurbitaria cava TaxID=798079 RepID=A0A9W8YEP1_9PLEO|nr:hypothetical protein N0V83_001327 [Neocucurbitaria cava]